MELRDQLTTKQVTQDIKQTTKIFLNSFVQQTDTLMGTPMLAVTYGKFGQRPCCAADDNE
jgi:hypothetical protein